MEIVITKHKLAHIIQEDHTNGWDGYWSTMCGKWARAIKIGNAADALPEGVRMCKLCQKSRRSSDAQSD